MIHREDWSLCTKSSSPELHQSGQTSRRNTADRAPAQSQQHSSEHKEYVGEKNRFFTVAKEGGTIVPQADIQYVLDYLTYVSKI